MKRTDPAHVQLAIRLRDHEAAGGATSPAAAAALIARTLHAHLAPLLGADGVDMLLTRSATLMRTQHAALAGVTFAAGSTTLQEALAVQTADVAKESAAALFGAFFTLLTTFIGERLTTQLLRKEWPAIDLTKAPSSKEST